MDGSEVDKWECGNRVNLLENRFGRLRIALRAEWDWNLPSAITAP